MNLKIEVIIDIDPRRRAILAGTVEDVEPDQLQVATDALARAVTTQALTAAAVGADGIEPVGAEIAAGAGAEPLAPSQRKPRPDDPATMQTFGDDDD